MGSGFGEPDNTPDYELPGIRPRTAQLIIDSVHLLNQKSRGYFLTFSLSWVLVWNSLESGFGESDGTPHHELLGYPLPPPPPPQVSALLDHRKQLIIESVTTGTHWTCLNCRPTHCQFSSYGGGFVVLRCHQCIIIIIIIYLFILFFCAVLRWS